MPAAELRLAMWSGPRNISTALMRSFGNRPDTIVCDEPLYAHYLDVTKLDHPGANEVIRHHDADCRSVVDWLTGPIPGGKSIFYQKQMAHHLLPDIDRGWLGRISNAFLIREPREMLTSLVRILPNPTLADTGLPQQVEIFRLVLDRGGAVPPVVDARDILENPRGVLSRLCSAVGLPFTDAMLSWPSGPRETDGIWAKHWYSAVEKTNSFGPYVPKPEPIPDHLRGLLDDCIPLYETLFAHRLLGAGDATA